MSDDEMIFGGVILEVGEMIGFLAEDGQSLLIMESKREADEAPTVVATARMLEQARRCGLPHGVAVVDEWTEDNEGRPLHCMKLA